MAILTIEDLTGSREAIAFAEAYERLGELLVAEAILFLTGTLDRRREQPQIIVDQAIPIDQAVEQLTTAITLRLGRAWEQDELLKLAEILRGHAGRSPVHVEVVPTGRADLRVLVRPSEQWFVAPSRSLYEELCQLLGEENVVLIPRRSNGNSGNGPGSERYARPSLQNRARQRNAFAPSGQGPG